MNRAERRAIARANGKTSAERKQIAEALKLADEAERDDEDAFGSPALIPPGAEEV